MVVQQLEVVVICCKFPIKTKLLIHAIHVILNDHIMGTQVGIGEFSIISSSNRPILNS